MVAVCDVLGFGKMVEQSSSSELTQHISDLVKLLTYASIPPGDKTSDKFKVGHAFFSDTVLLYSLTAGKYSFHDLISVITYLIAHPLKHPRYRFRAGIAFGDFYCDPRNNVYAGKALIEAHKLEKEQAWCGAALTEEAGNAIIDTDLYSRYLVKYDVPMKNGRSENHFAINWTQAGHGLIGEESGWLAREYDTSLTNEEKKEIECKIKNTELFHFNKCVQCKAYRDRLRTSENS